MIKVTHRAGHNTSIRQVTAGIVDEDRYQADNWYIDDSGSLTVYNGALRVATFANGSWLSVAMAD